MVCYNVKFDDDADRTRPSPAVMAKEIKYCKWTSADMIKYQLQFYKHPHVVSIKEFYKNNLLGTRIPEKTFGTYWRESGLKTLKESGTDIGMAQIAIESHVAHAKKNAKKQTIPASEGNRYLTEQEEKTIVHMALAIGKAGRGVDRDELLEMINSVVNNSVDEREREQATEKVVKDILARHPLLMKLVNAGSLDPLRAKKANKKTRDTVFSKLQAQTRGLYAAGLIPWKNYCDIPSYLVYNMDEVGTDTTKHRRKVIADKRNIFQRIFTITPEGDRMKGHITACVTTRADGKFFNFVLFYFILFYNILLILALRGLLIVALLLLLLLFLLTFMFLNESLGKYQDVANGIEGACGPVLIHCDATKTDEKTQEERERQRNGEAPTESNVHARFLKGMDLPEVLVRTSKSGSMTQEIFYDYCKHFVSSLEEEHEPVILFLDGHASRWNTQALKYLFDNNVFVFFFASHTSIWAQPNDCGLNKRVHWAIEEACKKYRRGGRVTSQGYFNEIFCMGWRCFRDAEVADLLECFENNATRAYERTGVYPLDPFAEAWADAIDGLGVANEDCETVSYEIVPRSDKMPDLSPDEKQLLRTDLDLDDKNDLGDYYCAEIQSTKILGKWWGNIEKGVSEGNELSEYSGIHLPESFATTDCEKLVMTLIAFEPIDVNKIPLPAPKSKEQRAEEISTTIIDLTRIAQPIHISYLVEPEPRTNNTGPLLDSSMGVWFKGTGIKRKNGSWRLNISNGDEVMLTSKEMLTSSNVYVQKAYTELNESERKRTLSKKNRIRNTATKKKEKEYIKLAQERQKEEERKEFDKMMESIEGGAWGFSDFKALATRMREPFSCDIDGVNVQVTTDDAAVMFDRAALGAIKRVLVIEGGDKNNEGGGGPPQKKRKNTAAAETGLGLGCNKAHFQTDRRDRTQNANAQATKLKKDLKEKDNLIEILTVFDARKKLYMDAFVKWRASTTHGPCPHPPFWVCRERENKKVFRLFLRMFLPKYGNGVLTSTLAVQRACIQNKIRGTLDLTESSVNAKAEELRRRLRTVETVIKDSQTGDEDPIPQTV
jgi:hypothetical protein